MTDLSTAMIAAIEKETSEANAIAERVARSKDSTSGKVISEMRDKTPITELPEEIRPEIEKFRTQIEKLDATREKMVSAANSLVTANLPNVEVLTPAEIAELKKTYGEHRSSVRQATKFAVEKLHVLTKDDVAKLPSLKTFSGGTASTTNAGTGSSKPRWESITCNGEDVSSTNEAGKVARTLTVLALKINSEHKDEKDFVKVTSAELIEALSQSAGTSDFGTVTEVALGKFRGQYDILAYPKQSAK